MTVTPHTGGGEVGAFSDDIGLEDVDSTDVVVPRLRIDHQNGVFVERNSGFETSVLDCVILGMVKQRIFWRGDIDEGDKPACKSPDFQNGFPNLDERTSHDKRFPVEKSNFDLTQFPPRPEMNNHVALPCASCVFSQWQKVDGKNVPPPCAEQHTFPLMYTPDEGESWFTALLTVQKTGIRPSKQYLSYFAQTKNPMFTVRTRIGLDQLRRGSVTYCVPKFKRGEGTDPSHWEGFAENSRSLREFLRTPPQDLSDTPPGEPDANAQAWDNDAATKPESRTDPAAAPQPAPQPAPVSEPASVAEQPAAAQQDSPQPAQPASEPASAAPDNDDDDDLPF